MKNVDGLEKSHVSACKEAQSATETDEKQTQCTHKGHLINAAARRRTREQEHTVCVCRDRGDVLCLGLKNAHPSDSAH